MCDLLISDLSNLNINEVQKLPVRQYNSYLEHSLNIDNFKRGGELKLRNTENELKASKDIADKVIKNKLIKRRSERNDI